MNEDQSDAIEDNKYSQVLEERFKNLIRENRDLYVSFLEEFTLYEPIESHPVPVQPNSFPRWDKVLQPQFKKTISLDVSFQITRGRSGWFCGNDYIEYRHPKMKSYLDELNRKWGKSSIWSFFPFPYGDSRNLERSGIYGIIDAFGKMDMEFEFEGYEGDDAIIRWRQNSHSSE